MVHYKLSYFDTRGLGEPIRLLFNYAKVDFEDFRFTREQWATIKPTTPIGKIPLLEFDGNFLVQSAAISRYLAKKFGLAGKDDLEQAKVDAIVDENKDFKKAIPWLMVKYEDVNGEKTKIVPEADVYLPLYKKYLQESGSGFLVKSGITFADFQVSEFLITLQQNAPEVIEKYPDLIKYLNRLKNLPQLKEYYASRKE
uniref:Glutathione S-transferase n=1 Tax=Panagrolaimus sp. ES5 TaxID=591445 RepID=A0AC34GAH4_9BILA